MYTELDEQRSLGLLKDFQSELTNALNSLGGRQSGGLLDNYNVHSTKHIHRAADGFIQLRETKRVYSSKLLIRPAIEVMFRLEAVRRSPDLLYRIAFSERLEDQKLARPVAASAGEVFDEESEKQEWEAFKASYRAQVSTNTLVDQKLTAAGAAQEAGKGMAGYYDSHYRTYCQYTHGALRAIDESFDEVTDPEDNRAMTMCVFVAVNVLASMNAVAPNLQVLHDRLIEASPLEN
jgi:Family of unknown function (DUF5677)